MIKLTYKHFMSFGFRQATQKLESQNFPAQTAYELKKMIEKFKKWRKQIHEEYLTLVDTFARKDEKGEIIRPEGDPTAFDVPDDQQDAYKKAAEEFEAREITVDRRKLTLDRLGNVQFTPAELTVLDPLFEDEEAEKVAPVVGQIGAKA